MAAAFPGRVDMVRLLLRRDAEVTCQKAMRAAGVEIDIERVQAGRVNCAAVLAGNKP
jgi:hypothetical protein